MNDRREYLLESIASLYLIYGRAAPKNGKSLDVWVRVLDNYTGEIIDSALALASSGSLGFDALPSPAVFAAELSRLARTREPYGAVIEKFRRYFPGVLSEGDAYEWVNACRASGIPAVQIAHALERLVIEQRRHPGLGDLLAV